jgi:hypothetical protein
LGERADVVDAALSHPERSVRRSHSRYGLSLKSLNYWGAALLPFEKVARDHYDCVMHQRALHGVDRWMQQIV